MQEGLPQVVFMEPRAEDYRAIKKRGGDAAIVEEEPMKGKKKPA